MKTIAIATLFGLFLSTSAFANAAGCVQHVKSSASKAGNSYVYINRIDSPINNTSHTPSAIDASQL